MKLAPLVLGLAAGLWLAASSGSAHRGQSRAVDCSTMTPENVDDCVRVNEIQMLGTHNSYHLAPLALDNTDAHRTDYLRGNPALEGRMLFVSSAPGEPSAAFIKMNEALGDDEGRIRENVRNRYLIRTRADMPTDEARSGSTTRRDSAFRSGAHYVSSDYPEESPFGSGYRARLPGADGLAARCNPVSAPAGCRNEWLERRGIQPVRR